MSLLKPALALSLAVVSGLVLGAIIAAIPSRWSDAVMVKICRDGTPILRRQNGEYWARRSGFTSYRVEDHEHVCQ
jgi:hypothetical protein